MDDYKLAIFNNKVIQNLVYSHQALVSNIMIGKKHSTQSMNELKQPAKIKKQNELKGQQQKYQYIDIYTKDQDSAQDQSNSEEEQQQPNPLQHQNQSIHKQVDQEWQQLQTSQKVHNNSWFQKIRTHQTSKHSSDDLPPNYDKHGHYQSKTLNQRKNNYQGRSCKHSQDQKQKRKHKLYKKIQRQYKQDVQFNERLNIIIFILILFIAGVVILHKSVKITDLNSFFIQDKILQPKDIIPKQPSKSKQIVNQVKKADKEEFEQKIPDLLIEEERKVKQQIKWNIQKPQNTNRPQITLKKNSIYQQQYSSTLNLNDLETDEVYINAPPDIKQIFNQMMKRPPTRTTRPNSIFVPSQKAYFAYRLFQNPQNERYLKAEYYYYDKKYKIGQYKDELPLCIVAPGRNIVRGNKFKRFIDSIQHQNYSNYILVYLDDNSDDNSSKQFQNYVKQTNGPLNKDRYRNQQYDGSFILRPGSKQSNNARSIIVQNKQRRYALANRNEGVRNFCPLESIVLDVDSDDALIGRQVFKFVNAVYHDPEVWMFNSVFIYQSFYHQDEVTTGPQDGVPQEILENNQYRTSMVWKTSQLRTFKAKLFNKIDEKDFKNDKDVFYQWASDVFIQEPLIELAGPKHYKHLYEIVYFYDWDFDKTTVYKRRHYRDIVFMQTPYQPLNSLEDEARKVENYIIPQRIKDEYNKNIVEARKQATRYQRQAPF